MKKNKYKFIDENNQHLHLLWTGKDYKTLTGTTSIVGILEKPLSWWASGMAVAKLGWTNEWQNIGGKRTKVSLNQRIKHLMPIWAGIRVKSEVEVLDLLDEAYKSHNEHKNEKAVEGTNRHAECEKFILGEMSGKGSDIKDEKVKQFIEWSKKNVRKFLWSELYCYSKKYFIGGICDAGVILNDGSIALIDFKSSKEAYFGQFIQCALYDIELSENGGFTKDGEKIFELEKPITKYIIFPFGSEKVEPEEINNIEELKEAAKSAIIIYRIKNKLKTNT